LIVAPVALAFAVAVDLNVAGFDLRELILLKICHGYERVVFQHGISG
jgi:hypothetical protein